MIYVRVNSEADVLTRSNGEDARREVRRAVDIAPDIDAAHVGDGVISI